MRVKEQKKKTAEAMEKRVKKEGKANTAKRRQKRGERTRERKQKGEKTVLIGNKITMTWLYRVHLTSRTQVQKM